MKQITGYWFCKNDRRLGYSDGRPVFIGETHEVEGDLRPCGNGLHLSKHPFDALQYASGPVIYKVKGFGGVIPHGNPVDKYCCRKRKYLAGGIDISKELHKFACDCALDVVHLWNAPDVVLKYLHSPQKKYRVAAGDAALDAANAADRRAASAASAAISAANTAAWEAADAAARAAANAAAWSAAIAANAASWTASRAINAAAWTEGRVAQRKKFNRMVYKLVQEA